MKFLLILLTLFNFKYCALANSQEVEKPNVLFIISDDLGARLSCYGEPGAKSPHLDQLASQGTLFERCYSQRPTCGPSRMSMLSGLYLHESGLTAQRSRITKSLIPAISLPHLFRKNGYFTSRVGKIFHMGVPSDIGTAGTDDPKAWDLAVNNTGWDGDPKNLAKVKRYGSRTDHGVAINYLDPDIADHEMVDGVGTAEASRIMNEKHPDVTGKPLMLFVGYFRTHPPMISPRSHWDAIDTSAIQLPNVPANDREDIPQGALPLEGPGHHFLPAEFGLEYSHAYYAAIHFVDQQIGILLNELEANGLSKNTIVVVTGDQGFHLGEHHYWHKTSAFDPSCHVPLIVYDPRTVTEGKRHSGLCGLIDLYPTLCDLVEIEPEHALSGRSLKPMLEEPHLAGKEWELSALENGNTLRTDRYRYTELKQGTMLYDLKKDPEELENLSGRTEFAEIESRLRDKLRSILR